MSLRTSPVRRHTTRAFAAAGAAALALTLAGCAANDTTGTSARPQAETTVSTPLSHNDADTEFAQMMIVHHEGAVRMAELVIDTSESAQILDLAERILAAQTPEIETMERWLVAWGEDLPEDADHGMMSHNGMTMNGMDMDEAMDALRETELDGFDAMFLTMMIAHHEGAIEMSEDEIDDGQNAEAIALATNIIEAQQAEITEMKALLAESSL